MIHAWRSELGGGAIALASLALYYLLHAVWEPGGFAGFLPLAHASPGLLLLFCGLATPQTWREIGLLPPWKSGVSFIDAIRTPGLLAETRAAQLRERERIDALPADRLVAELLKACQSPDDDDFDVSGYTSAIKKAGGRAIPYLMTALEKATAKRKPDDDARSAANVTLRRVINCLESEAPKEAIPLVSKHLDHPDEWVRRTAAQFLASSGHDEALEILASIFKTDDCSLEDGVANGLLAVLQGNRAGPSFRRRMFDLLAAWKRWDYQTPGILLDLDPTRGAALLTEHSLLLGKPEQLHNILAALQERGISVDESVLLELVGSIEILDENRPWDDNAKAVKFAIQLLAPHSSSAATAAIEQAAKSPWKNVREGAALALAARAGIEEPYRFVWELSERLGDDALTLPQRYVREATRLQNEVENGGFAQYFLNYTGDHWREAQDALIAIGCKGDLAIFRKTLAAFPNGAPSLDSATRRAQLARIPGDDGDLDSPPFDAACSQYYKDPDDREVLLIRYAIANADHFRAAKEP
jgi:HEAT repeat protein